MVTQEIMDEWMDGGMVFSNNNFFKKKMRGFLCCLFLLHEFSSLRVDLRSKLTFMQCPPTQ